MDYNFDELPKSFGEMSGGGLWRIYFEEDKKESRIIATMLCGIASWQIDDRKIASLNSQAQTGYVSGHILAGLSCRPGIGWRSFGGDLGGINRLIYFIDNICAKCCGFGQPNSVGPMAKCSLLRAWFAQSNSHPSRRARATAHEIMSITGHRSLEEVERYTRAARRGKLADAAMRKFKSRTDTVPPK